MSIGRTIVVIFGIILATVAEQTNSESEDSDTGLALELHEPTSNKESKEIDVKLKNVKHLIGEAKTVIDRAKEVIVNNSNLRRDFRYNEKGKFIDFIGHLIEILKKYDDKDLEEVFAIIGDQLRKYHYRGCKFHELIDNHYLRRFIAKKLGGIRSMAAVDIRHCLEAISFKLKLQSYSQKERDLLDFINSLYEMDSIDKFNKILVNFDDYRLKTRKNLDLVAILKDGIRSVVFDHFTNLNSNARIAFKSKVDEFFNYVMGVAASYAMQHYLNKLKLPDTFKIAENDEVSDDINKRIEATEESRTTRQVYIEKNDPFTYKYTTNRHKYDTGKSFKMNEKDQISLQKTNKKRYLRDMVKDNNNNLNHESVKAKLTYEHKEGSKFQHKNRDDIKDSSELFDAATTLRQLYLESIDVGQEHVKTQPHKDKHSVELNVIDNHQHLDKKKLFSNSRHNSTPPKHMHVKFDDTKSEMQVNTNSKKIRSKSKNVNKRIYKLQDKHMDKMQREAKSFEWPTTLRQLYVESMDAKHLPAKKHSHKAKHAGNLRSIAKKEINKKKHYIESRDSPTTLKQMYLESLKYDSNSLKQRSKDISVTDIYKTNNKVSTLRQMYLESIDSEYDYISKGHKTKLTTLKDSKTTREVSYSGNIERLVKSASEPSNFRGNQVQIMDLKYEPRAHSTEIINKEKNIPHAHSKKYKKRNLFIDVNAFLMQKHFKYATTTDRSIAENQPDIHNARRRLIKTKIALNQRVQKNKLQLRTGKRKTSGKPKDIKILTVRGNEKTERTVQSKRVIDFLRARRRKPVIVNRKKVLSAKLNKTSDFLKPSATINNVKTSMTFDPIDLDGRISVKEYENVSRRMADDIFFESLLNDTAVLTKIQQLESELKVVKTQLENDTKIIENLNSTVCKTENKLKEYCNQEFKIVRAGKNMVVDDQSTDSDESNEIRAVRSSEYKAHKRFQVAKRQRDQDEADLKYRPVDNQTTYSIVGNNRDENKTKLAVGCDGYKYNADNSDQVGKRQCNRHEAHLRNIPFDDRSIDSVADIGADENENSLARLHVQKRQRKNEGHLNNPWILRSNSSEDIYGVMKFTYKNENIMNDKLTDNSEVLTAVANKTENIGDYFYIKQNTINDLNITYENDERLHPNALIDDSIHVSTVSSNDNKASKNNNMDPDESFRKKDELIFNAESYYVNDSAAKYDHKK